MWCKRAVVLGVAGLALLAGDRSLAEDAVTGLFDANQAYDILFSLHPQETDKLSGIRVIGVRDVGQKAFLEFEVLLSNQKQRGLIDLQTVSAILPTGKPVVATSALALERRPIEKEKVSEVRTESVREVVKEVQVPTRGGQ